MLNTAVKNTLDGLLENCPTRTYKKGEIILFQGEAPQSSYIIKKGVVKAYNLSIGGDEKPVGFYVESDIFPAPWTFKKASSAIYYYEAFVDTEVYLVPREKYLNYLKLDINVMFREMEKLVVDHLGNTMRLNALQHSRASDKLIYTLHYLAMGHGKNITNRIIEVELDLTHQDFANLTGLTRETTATELNKLKTKGVITYGKHTRYRIDLDKLMAMLNDQFIADLEVDM